MSEVRFGIETFAFAWGPRRAAVRLVFSFQEVLTCAWLTWVWVVLGEG